MQTQRVLILSYLINICITMRNVIILSLNYISRLKSKSLQSWTEKVIVCRYKFYVIIRFKQVIFNIFCEMEVPQKKQVYSLFSHACNSKKKYRNQIKISR